MTMIQRVAITMAAMQQADRRHQRGAGLVEYTMLLILIVVVCIAAITLLGDSTNSSYSEISSHLG